MRIDLDEEKLSKDELLALTRLILSGKVRLDNVAESVAKSDTRVVRDKIVIVKNRGVRRDHWKRADVKFLRDNIKTMPIQEIAEHLGRTETAVRVKGVKLRLRIKDRWTKEEEQFIKDHMSMSITDLAKALDKTSSKVSSKFYRLKKEVELSSKEPEQDTPKEHESEYMVRDKPVVPLTEDERRILMSNRGTESDTQLVFPDIYPVHKESKPFLERLVQDIVEKKGTIHYNDVISILMTEDGQGWDIRKWIEFCYQFMYNAGGIKKYFNVKGTFMLVKEGSFQAIKYA